MTLPRYQQDNFTFEFVGEPPLTFRTSSASEAIHFSTQNMNILFDEIKVYEDEENNTIHIQLFHDNSYIGLFTPYVYKPDPVNDILETEMFLKWFRYQKRQWPTKTKQE